MTPDFYYGEMLRWSFGFENPNKAAVIFACVIPLLWAGWWAAFRVQSSWWKGVGLVASAIGFLSAWGCLLLTFSRGGLVAAVAGMVVVSAGDFCDWTNYRKEVWAAYFRSRRVWFSGLLIGVVVVGALLLGMGSRSVEALGDDASVGNRIELWGAALQMAYENPAGFGAGRSGAEFMQWYQDVDRTEGYRTMVNSYLTFLVEHGWLAFVLVSMALAAFWAWTWPGKEAAHDRWRIALWASLVAFIVSGVFSTTMEEPLVWIVPALANAGLIGFRIIKGNPLRVSKTQFAIALGTACILLSVLFIAGRLKSSADPLQRTFARTPEKSMTVVAVSPKTGVTTLRQLFMHPDDSVLGPNWGKLVRKLALETSREILINKAEETPKEIRDILLVGEAIHHSPVPAHSGQTFLLAPAICDGQMPENSILLIAEIDEDGRSSFWQEKVGSAHSPSREIVILSGVGTRVEWAWDQVIDVINAPQFRE